MSGWAVRHGRLVAVLFALALIVGTTISPVEGQGRSSTYTSLAEAVAAGVLDPDLAARVADGEQVEAVVRYEMESVLRDAHKAPSRGSIGHDGVMRRVETVLLGRHAAVRAALEHGARGRVLRALDRVGVSLVELSSEAAVLAVLNEPGVAAIAPNRIVTPTDAESAPLVRQPTAAEAGYNGAGVTVAVIDTGLDYTHAAFGSCTAPGRPSACRVVVARDIAADDGALDTGSFHGTNVGGIVAGIAPDARLVALDVFGANGTATSVDIAAAIDWGIANRATYGIRVMNLSLGAGSYGGSCRPDPGFTEARSFGILPVVAAGNSGDATGIAWPACVAGAVSVGAVYDADVGSRSYAPCRDAITAADRVACFSQSSEALSVWAPGAIVTAAGRTMAGTSQAAPHVAGAAAILAAAAPSATTADITEAMMSAGPSILDARNKVTRHRLDVTGALERLLGITIAAPFSDITDSPFYDDIVWLAAAGITTGCGGDRFCPKDGVTRGQMATFLTRALDLPPASGDYFSDDGGIVHEPNINSLAAAGITTGCGGDRFCPKDGVSRGQMAAFLHRALE